MTLSALASYSTVPRQYTTPAKQERTTPTNETKTTGPAKETSVRVALKDSLSPSQMEKLETLRSKKEDMSNRLSQLEERFASAERGFGQNLSADIDSVVDIGRQMYSLINGMESIQSQVSDVLKSAKPSDAEGIVKGKGNDLYDCDCLAGDYSMADRMKTFMANLFDAYKSTRESAIQSGDTTVLQSDAMKLADKFGQRMMNWTKQYMAGFNTAAANAQSVSVVV